MSGRATTLTDGAWHRLHPATPLLRGGIIVVALLGIVIGNLRNRIVDWFVGAPDYQGDPIDTIYSRGITGWVLLALVGVLLVGVALFWLSWRMHTFRIGDDAVEVRSGLVFRTHRNARLDRIQGINVARPLVARLFGAAKLEVSVAGQDANVQLAYLSSALADGVRRDLLRLASGARAAAGERPEAAGTAEAAGHGEHTTIGHLAVPGHVDPVDRVLPDGARGDGVVSRRVNELLAPELDPDAAPPESIVRIPPHRIIASLALSGFTVFVLAVVAAVVIGLATHQLWPLFFAVPGVLAAASYYVSRFTRSLRYSIAGTPDGVRVGFGLFSTSNETLPPGRIHAVEVFQPLFWRPFGWWQIKVNTAGHSRQQRGAAGQSSSTILPVGDEDDAVAVLGLVLPEFDHDERRVLARTGILGRADTAFTCSPPRARWLHPLSWRRTGFVVEGGVAVVRRGYVWRRLVLVPLARLQSVEVAQGPLYRRLDLVGLRLHTVDGPVHSRLPGADRAIGVALFEDVARLAVEWAGRDTSHRWSETEPGISFPRSDPPVGRPGTDGMATGSTPSVSARVETRHAASDSDGSRGTS